MTSLVGKGQERYALTFVEAMDRPSVESKIAEQLMKVDPGREAIPASVRFDWADDRRLTVVVMIDPRELESFQYPYRGYQIDANGALTAGGRVLASVPVFRAIPSQPQQVARISADGKTIEKLSDFTEPYGFEPLKQSRYFLASRSVGYCECDATFPKLSWLYDSSQNRLTPYPVPLTTDYRGGASFVADTRGFFFELPAASGMKGIPASSTAYPIQMDQYVHGAGFSPDGKSLLVLTGQEEKPDRLLLQRVTLADGRRTVVQELLGGPPISMVSDLALPVHFQTSGSEAYFFLWNGKESKEERYVYDWSKGQVTNWNPPVEQTSWSGFSESGDGRYRLYANSGLYEGTTKLADVMKVGYSTEWLYGTHAFLSIRTDFDMPPNAKRNSLSRYDADKRAWSVIRPQLPEFAQLLRASEDGKWIYLGLPW